MIDKKLINKLTSSKNIKKNKPAFKSYKIYKKAANILELADFATGKKNIYQTTNNSSANAQINYNAISSTQKIV